MIEKWYCLRCDECGEVIDYHQCSSAKKALKLSRGYCKGEKITCEDCRKEEK